MSKEEFLEKIVSKNNLLISKKDFDGIFVEYLMHRLTGLDNIEQNIIESKLNNVFFVGGRAVIQKSEFLAKWKKF